MKKFNPKTKNVSTIGEELRFQREYYCFKNNISLPLKVDSTSVEEKKTIGDILFEYMEKNLGDNNELNASYEILYAIENGKKKKKGEKYNAGTYYLRMFCLFKIYNFLDDETIIELLERYNIFPSFQDTKAIYEKIIKSISVGNYMQRGDLEKIVHINIKHKRITVSKEQATNWLNYSKEELKLIERAEKQKSIKWCYKEGEITKKEIDSILYLGYDWRKEYDELVEKMKKLSKIERYCTSLELGKDTSYIDDFIVDNLQDIRLDILLKTLTYFKMNDNKFYNILLKMKNSLSSETLKRYTVK